VSDASLQNQNTNDVSVSHSMTDGNLLRPKYSEIDAITEKSFVGLN